MAATFDRFVEELREYVQSAETARRAKRSHDYRRHLFLAFLQKAFEIEAKEIDVEKGVKALKLRGRIDALFRDIVFEFKRDLEAERETGKGELRKYLSSSEVSGHCFGVLTDGITFEVYALRDDRLTAVDRPVDLKTLAEDSHAALLWFDSFLFSQRDVAPKSDDVVRRFGAGSAVFSAASAQLEDMFARLSDDGSTQTKFREWNSLLAKVYGSREVGTIELFIRHTYLSTLAKVFAYLVLSKVNYAP